MTAEGGWLRAALLFLLPPPVTCEASLGLGLVGLFRLRPQGL
jgi:hypothetical protein